MSTVRAGARPNATLASLWVLLACYAAARFLPLAGDRIPVSVIAAMHIFPPLVFAYFHGAASLGRRAILVFFALFLVVGNVIENTGVVTGFPFGHYYFTDRMGPKFFHVPILLGLAYLGMGYISWTLAVLILRNQKEEEPFAWFRVIAIPMMAALLMVAWDLSQDAVWSTIQQCWVWSQGGAYFGVPLSNFFGWFLSTYIFFQLFALYLRRCSSDPNALPARYRQPAILFYLLCAAGNLVLLFVKVPANLAAISDAAGVSWNIRDILNASALVSIFVMGPLALVAWLRMAHHASESPLL